MDTNSLMLRVHKNSPHIWAGGLEGKELADWLIGKANAIMVLERHRELLIEASDTLIELQSSEDLKMAYVSLGLSLKESDPTRSPSTEAVQFDVALGRESRRRAHSSPTPVTPVLPMGFSLLSDLDVAREKFLQKKAELSGMAATQCGQKSND